MLLYQILGKSKKIYKNVQKKIEKIIKSHTKTINLKYQVHQGMKNLIYLIDHILYQIFKIILNISLKK